MTQALLDLPDEEHVAIETEEISVRVFQSGLIYPLTFGEIANQRGH